MPSTDAAYGGSREYSMPGTDAAYGGTREYSMRGTDAAYGGTREYSMRGTDAAYGGTREYSMPGTDAAYDGTREYSMPGADAAYGGTREYSMRGTDAAYDGTREYSMRGTGAAYGGTVCVVLTQCTAVPETGSRAVRPTVDATAGTCPTRQRLRRSWETERGWRMERTMKRKRKRRRRGRGKGVRRRLKGRIGADRGLPGLPGQGGGFNVRFRLAEGRRVDGRGSVRACCYALATPCP
eukprot:1976338-Rhodomonas_salina.1